jgi:hypothetical protein
MKKTTPETGTKEMGVPRIEVTPEMIDAGRSELAGYDSVEGAENTAEVLSAIWRAMLAVACRRLGKTR